MGLTFSYISFLNSDCVKKAGVSCIADDCYDLYMQQVREGLNQRTRDLAKGIKRKYFLHGPYLFGGETKSKSSISEGESHQSLSDHQSNGAAEHSNYVLND